MRQSTESFRCRNCGMYVPCDPALSGVQNRNHCPYCLWSRHLDGQQAGDRRSACRALMRPVGLTTKRSHNRYAREADGELMVVHACTVCGKLVLNRIAADDSTHLLMELLWSSDEAAGSPGPEDGSVALLTVRDAALVRRRLFGHVACQEEVEWRAAS